MVCNFRAYDIALNVRTYNNGSSNTHYIIGYPINLDEITFEVFENNVLILYTKIRFKAHYSSVKLFRLRKLENIQILQAD